MDTSRKVSFEAECAKLVPLETFDPNAFRSDDKVPQSLCNVTLTLALIFNDLKDLFDAKLLLDDFKPEVKAKTRVFGNHAGLHIHVARLILSAVHELFVLLKEHKEELEHPFFQAVVKKLPADIRRDWSEIVQVALGHTPTDKRLGKLLLKIRNNVSFHYDPKAIEIGFKNHFTERKFDERAYISRGPSIEGSRFYFADAAVEGLLRVTEENHADNSVAALRQLLRAVGIPLIRIVGGFIQERGYGFRQAE